MLLPIILSWDFVWYGNPDQDLVFLRDGLRLYRSQAPLYIEHPGAAQSFTVAFAIFIHSFLWGHLDLMLQNPPSDEWQAIFQFSKSANLLVYSFLLTLLSVQVGTLIGQAKGIIFGFMTSLSAGIGVELVQLRNEVYSGLFFYLACITVLAVISKVIKGQYLSPFFVVQYSIAYVACAVFSIMAKVQVLPCFCLLSIGLALFVVPCNSTRCTLRLFSSLFLCIILSLFALGSLQAAIGTQLANLSILSGLLTLCTLTFPLCCLLVLLAGPSRKNGLALTFVIVLVELSLLLIFFGSISPGWIYTSINPFSSLAHSTSANQCISLACKMGSVYKGIEYLYERTFGGGLLPSAMLSATISYQLSRSIFLPPRRRSSYIVVAAIVSIVLLADIYISLQFGVLGKTVVILASVLAFFAACRVRSVGLHSTQSRLGFYLFVSSFAMAGFCSLRWPVDHYLFYQQPLLFICFLLGLGRLASPNSIVFLVVLVASLFLVQSRNLRLLDVTYQQSLSWSSPGLCAPQHQGREWSNTFLANLPCLSER